MDDNKTLKAARAYVARGLGVFPLNGKVPVTEHGVKDATLDDAQVTEWFGHTRNLGIAIPKLIVVVDIDPRNGGVETFCEWLETIPDARDAFDNAPMARTGGGGYHYWFRYDGRALVKAIGGVDFQRLGKYVVAPPSVTAEPYVWQRTLPAKLNELGLLPPGLLELATPIEREPERGERVYDGDDPLDVAAHRYTTWEDLLEKHGWQFVGDDRWRHPDSENQFSATLTNECLFVYSPNTPFPVTETGAPAGVTLWRAIETLDFGGNRPRMVHVLRESGHLDDTRPFAEIDDFLDRVLPAASVLPELQRTTSLDAAIETPAEPEEVPLGTWLDWPTLKRKDDDIEQRWLVEPVVAIGRAHALYAEAKVGKSMFMLALCAALATGRPFLGQPAGDPQRVMYADYEMTEDDVAERLEGFGYDLDDPLLDNLRYFLLGSGEGLDTPAGGLALVKSAYLVHATLVVVDTTSRAVVGGESDADTVRAFYRCTGAPLKRLGISVVRLDHAGKDATKGQRGTSAKNDDVDVVWRLTVQSRDQAKGIDNFTLEATHHRMGWVPNEVPISMEEGDDGVYRWAARATPTSGRYPNGTNKAAAVLDALDVALDVSIREVKRILREVDPATGEPRWKGSNKAAEHAQKWRVAERAGLNFEVNEARDAGVGTRVDDIDFGTG